MSGSLRRFSADMSRAEELAEQNLLAEDVKALQDLPSSYTDEQARDAIGTALVAGSFVTITVNDGADTITVAVDNAAMLEAVRDMLATALVAGSNVTITPNDGSDTITIAATGGGGSYTDEEAQDSVGNILVDSSTIDFTYNDATPSITAGIVPGSIGATELAATAVTPGSYTNTDLTVDADGRITAASNGSGGSTVTLISEQTATGSEHAITFNSISNSYKSLRIEALGRTDEAVLGSSLILTLNNDTSAIYDMQRFYAQAASPGQDQTLSSAGWTTFISFPGTSATANHPGHIVVDIFNYSDTTFYKTMFFHGRQMNSTTTANAFTMTGNGSYRSTSAITRIDITITTSAKNFVNGSKFRLYGIS